MLNRGSSIPAKPPSARVGATVAEVAEVAEVAAPACPLVVAVWAEEEALVTEVFGATTADIAPESHTEEVPWAMILRAARSSGAVTMVVTMRPGPVSAAPEAKEGLWEMVVEDGCRPGGPFEEEEEEGDEEEKDEDDADVVVVIVVAGVAGDLDATDSQPPVVATAIWRANSALRCLRRLRASDGDTVEHATAPGGNKEEEEAVAAPGVLGLRRSMGMPSRRVGRK